MANVNKVILVGRLGKDPEEKNTRDGELFCTFSLATSKKIKGEDRTTWHNVVVWNANAAKFVCTYAKAGATLYVEGEIQTRKYEKDGVTRYATDIVVGSFGGDVRILSDGKGTHVGPHEGETTKTPATSREQATANDPLADDPLAEEWPF